jgi:hypothetical protein
MLLRLRRAKGTRPEPREWTDDDYDVTSDGVVVGRIYSRTGARDDAQPWFWSILAVVGSAGRMNGLPATLDEAQARSRKAGESGWSTPNRERNGKQQILKGLPEAQACSEGHLEQTATGLDCRKNRRQAKPPHARRDRPKR